MKLLKKAFEMLMKWIDGDKAQDAGTVPQPFGTPDELDSFEGWR